MRVLESNVDIRSCGKLPSKFQGQSLWVERRRHAAKYIDEHVLRHLRGIPGEVNEKRLADNKGSVLHRTRPISGIPFPVRGSAATGLRGKSVTALQWIGAVASHHAVVRQSKTTVAVPCSAGRVRGQHCNHPQNGSQSSLRFFRSIATLTKHVGYNVVLAKSWSKVISATQARDGRIAVLKVGLATYRSINERCDAEVLRGSAPSSSRNQRRIRVEIERSHDAMITGRCSPTYQWFLLW